MRSELAFSLVELVLVLAVVGVALAVGLVARPDSRVAQDAARLTQRLRLERLRQAVVGGAGALACIDGSQSDLASSVVAWPARGLAFDTQGLPRTCDGSGVGNATILLEHRGMRAAVIVSALGRVRWERR